ncbi:MAG: hypothetical protein NUV34_10635 [Sulfuricaulis sp.]|nr:hypothetical protein [Sulfuricaulis sp.]
MKLFLDNLFFLGEIVSLAGVAMGAWFVLRESLIGIVCPDRKNSGRVVALVACLAHPFRRAVRI